MSAGWYFAFFVLRGLRVSFAFSWSKRAFVIPISTTPPARIHNPIQLAAYGLVERLRRVLREQRILRGDGAFVQVAAAPFQPGRPVVAVQQSREPQLLAEVLHGVLGCAMKLPPSPTSITSSPSVSSLTSMPRSSRST